MMNFRNTRKRKNTPLERSKTFLPGDKVEVRSVEDGFQGSWHPGVVIDCRNQVREVKYDNLMLDDLSGYLTEVVEVSGVIDGNFTMHEAINSARGRIRPHPPATELVLDKLNYGFCVDAYTNEAWWEGVVFDMEDGSEKRMIFFPDMGDLMAIEVANLRITLDWDEIAAEWKPRGKWLFLDVIEEHKKYNIIPISIEQIWDDVREMSDFGKIGEWASPGKRLWQKVILDFFSDDLVLSADELLNSHEFSEPLLKNGETFLTQKRSLTYEPNPSSHALVKAHVHSGFEEACLMSEKADTKKVVNKRVRHKKSWDLEDGEWTVKSARKRMPSSIYDPSSPKSNELDIEPKYCPDVVFTYVGMSGSFSGFDKHRLRLAEKARKHLKAIGWSFWFKPKGGKDEWRYVSPTTGKTYYSLMTACAAIANGREFNTFNGPCTSSPMEVAMISSEKPKPPLCNIETKGESFSQTRSKMSKSSVAVEIEKNYGGETNGCLCHLTQQPEDGGSTDRVKNDGTNGATTIKLSSTSLLEKQKAQSSRVNKPTRALRLSKRIRQVEPCTNSQIPRTLLSWLIDNGVILPRAKVQYRNKRSIKPMAEGRITREGIKCNCCQHVFTLSGFEAHAGSSFYEPCASIFLEDGRSLVQCQMQMVIRDSKRLSIDGDQVEENKCQKWNDHICSVCQYGGELILCDHCPSSFHVNCLSLQDIPGGDWFCPSCGCSICGESHFDVKLGDFTDNSALCCHQCERQFHVRCINDREMVQLDAHPKEDWFCSKSCEKVNWSLQLLLGKQILVGHDNLTWTLTKPMIYNHSGDDDCDDVTMANNYSKLSVAVEVMHECFEPVKKPHAKRDLVEDVIFSRGSHLNRLNFRGFYTMLLERNDELISVATLRVYGNKVAEIPLICTRFKYRRLGMCRILIMEIEKNLLELGVERLVLPAAPSVVNTWTTSFGFSPMTQSDRYELLGYSFLNFQETVMCQKILRKFPSPLLRLSTDAHGIQHVCRQNIKGGKTLLDFASNSAVSEVVQEDLHERSLTLYQGAQTSVTEDKCQSADNDPNSPIPNHEDSEPREVFKREKILKFYTRKKAVELRTPGQQAKYSKFEVSCR